MLKNVQKKKKQRGGLLGILPGVLALAMAGPALTFPGIMILLHGGPWVIPLFLAYLALLMLPVSYWLSVREKNHLHFVMGDELFFTEFPEERSKALRRLMKKGVPPEREAILNKIEGEPRPPFPEEGADLTTKRRRGRLPFYVSGVLLLVLGAFLLVRGAGMFPGSRPAASKGGDLAFLFPLLGGGLSLLCALLAFLKKKSRILAPVTLLILLLGAWGTSVAPSKGSRLVWQEVAIGFGCALLFGGIAWGLLPRGRKILTPGGQYEAFLQQQRELLALGCIDEELLRIRLEHKRRELEASAEGNNKK